MKFTKAQLEEQILTLTHKLNDATATIELLRAQLKDHAELRSDMVQSVVRSRTAMSIRRALQMPLPAVKVYEWNPDVPGDFQRALRLAKENNGRCVRMRQGSPS